MVSYWVWLTIRNNGFGHRGLKYECICVNDDLVKLFLDILDVEIERNTEEISTTHSRNSSLFFVALLIVYGTRLRGVNSIQEAVVVWKCGYHF